MSDYETVINISDTTCDHCGDEIHKGEYCIKDRMEQDKKFCREKDGIEAKCWIDYYGVEEENGYDMDYL